MGIVAKMTTGVTFGTFDLLHAGHVMFLREAKEHVAHLTVGLHIDPSIERPQKNKPIQTLFERYIQLDALDAVDCIIPYETEKDLDYILRHYKFTKRFLGSEYRKDFDDRKVGSQNTCMLTRTEIVFLTRFHNFSSTELRERIKNG
jgi:glycerol-3-phosphate cytidylyltransferase